MFTEIRKSINSALYERASSPLYGTLIVSWLIWNWEIPYLTLFVTEDNLGDTKLSYILENYSNVHHLLTFPAISTVFLLTLMPFASNGAYYISLKFKKWRSDKRNEIEMKQLLSIEKSIELREEIRSQEDKFERLLDSKKEEIRILNQEVERYRIASAKNEEKDKNEVSTKRETSTKQKVLTKLSTEDEEFDKFKNSGKIEDFIKVGRTLLNQDLRNDQIPNFIEAKAFGLIENSGGGYSVLTATGKKFFKWIILNEGKI